MGGGFGVNIEYDSFMKLLAMGICGLSFLSESFIFIRKDFS
jgi:hypothetical protein